VNWHSKRQVLFVILGVVVVMLLAGMAAAWHNRNHTTCADGKPPVEQRGGLLGQTVFLCHNGQTVTTPG
jgi:flagellar basal body-associated protein FliL